MWWQTLRDDNPNKQKIKKLEEKQNARLMSWLIKQCKIPTNEEIINSFKK